MVKRLQKMSADKKSASHLSGAVKDSAQQIWLAGLGARELPGAIDAPPPRELSDFHANYLAAMAELACARHGVAPPAWTREVAPLARPAFASELASLRLHLLAHSPAPFRRRNLFIDTAVGGQV